MHYTTGKDRYELQLFNSLEDNIEDDNPVRLIDALVERIYFLDTSGFAYKGQRQRGRKSHHPCTLLKLYLYGYLHRISNSFPDKADINKASSKKLGNRKRRSGNWKR